MATDVDRAYAAGLFDGEGSVGVNWRRQSKRSKNKTFGVKAVVAMIDAESILWMQETFGGHVDTTCKSKSGSTVYRWTLHCRKAADFLELIVPYLKLKKARAEAAIKLARMARVRGARKGEWQMKGITAEETSAQQPIAEFIRGENLRSNPKIKSYSSWGVGNA